MQKNNGIFFFSLFWKFQRCWLLVELLLQVSLLINSKFKLFSEISLASFFHLECPTNVYLLYTGILTDPMAPSSFLPWMNHAGTHHIGAISFLIVDFFLFFGVAALTVVQASQVCLEILWSVVIFYFLELLFMVVTWFITEKNVCFTNAHTFSFSLMHCWVFWGKFVILNQISSGGIINSSFSCFIIYLKPTVIGAY